MSKNTKPGELSKKTIIDNLPPINEKTTVMDALKITKAYADWDHWDAKTFPFDKVGFQDELLYVMTLTVQLIDTNGVKRKVSFVPTGVKIIEGEK